MRHLLITLGAVLSLAGNLLAQPAGVASNLQLWLDADDMSTLYKDLAGTTPVTTAGDEVMLWKDKSGNGHDVSQSNTGALPVYVTNKFNGKPALDFDRNTEDHLTRDLLANGENWVGAYTVFIVFEEKGTPQLFWSFFSNGSPASNKHFQILFCLYNTNLKFAKINV